MSKVYLVVSGQGSELEVEYVCSTREKAQQIVTQYVEADRMFYYTRLRVREIDVDLFDTVAKGHEGLTYYSFYFDQDKEDVAVRPQLPNTSDCSDTIKGNHGTLWAKSRQKAYEAAKQLLRGRHE